MSSHSSPSFSATVAWIAAVSILGLFLMMCYAASVSATWPRARPRIPLWFLLLIIFFPPLFPVLLLFLFLPPPPLPIAYYDDAVPTAPRARRVVFVRHPTGVSRSPRRI